MKIKKYDRLTGYDQNITGGVLRVNDDGTYRVRIYHGEPCSADYNIELDERSIWNVFNKNVWIKEKRYVKLKKLLK